MGRGSRAHVALSDYSRRVVANVERLRDHAGLTNAHLITVSGMSRNYFYIRMRHEAAFTTEDIVGLAKALGVEPAVLSAVTERTETSLERYDGVKLSSRLHALVAANASFTFEALSTFMDASGTPLSKGTWAALLADKREVRVAQNTLEGIASYFEVDPRYLLNNRLDDVAERVEAELDVTAALREAGATSISLRALGELSPADLRGLATAIRSAIAADA
jgi:transcriptional regulator with XRE-family HTH domain